MSQTKLSLDRNISTIPGHREFGLWDPGWGLENGKPFLTEQTIWLLFLATRNRLSPGYLMRAETYMNILCMPSVKNRCILCCMLDRYLKHIQSPSSWTKKRYCRHLRFVLRTVRNIMARAYSCIKGKVPRILDFRFFSWISFPQATTPVVYLHLLISPWIFNKIRNDSNVIFRGMGEMSHEKTWRKKSRDTVPLIHARKY